MRTTWRLCGMPLRRSRRKHLPTSPSPSPSPSPPISLYLPANVGEPSKKDDEHETLSKFAEDASSGGLSDMDFDNVASLDEDDSNQSEMYMSACMVMDKESRKWTGNETDFETFSELVRSLGSGGVPTQRDLAPFRVEDGVRSEWEKDGKEHNEGLWGWKGGKDGDIRTLVDEFCEQIRER